MSDEPFFTAEDFKLEWETPDGVRFAAESKTGVRIAEGIAAVANAKVAPLIAENERLNRMLHSKGVACLTGDCDLVTGFACPICFKKLTEQNRIMKEALEFIRGRESFRDLDETEIAREALAKCREVEK